MSELRVEGNVAVQDELITLSSAIVEGQSYLSTEFGEVISRAISQLWLIDAFSDIRIWGEELGPDRIVVIIEVEEKPRLGTVTFRGNDKLKRTDLMNAGRINESMWLGPDNISLARERILGKYRNEGYLRAEVEFETLDVAGDSTASNLIVRVDEGPKVGIRAIEVYGNEILSDRQIRAAMTTGTGFLFFSRGEYNQRTIEEDKDNIADRYAEAGHLDARVVTDSLGYDESGRNMTLYFTVDEGEQYTLGTFTIEGIEKGYEFFDERDLENAITVTEGGPYNETEIVQSLINIQTLYMEEGYVYANYNPIPSYTGPDNRIVNITAYFTEGEPANVAHIFITGNTRTKEHVIRREVLLKPGNRFSSSLFQRSMREVMALNYFSNVELDPPPQPNAEGNLDVTIKVAERPTGQAIMGAGYSERDGIVGNIGLQLPNLFGNGQELQFNWDFGRIRRTILVGFTEPWLFNTPTLVGASVYRSEYFYNIYYKQRREGFTAQLGRRLRWPDDYFRINFGYRLEDTNFYDFDPKYNPSPAYDLRQWDWPIRNSSLSFTIYRDSRDRPEFPTRGSVNTLRTEISGGPLGGDEQYLKWDLNQSFYFPTWANVIMALKLRAGLVEPYRGYGQGGFIPFNEKYLPGGTSFDGQIRGYENRRVGPLDQDGLEIGGQSLLIFTMEYTFPLAPEQMIYGLVFADAGNAWLDLNDTDPFDLRRSVGFGLRMFTPMVGLIGFDFAYGFDHFENGRRKGRWIPHFQFGAQFY